MNAVLDNDIVHKGVSYRLLPAITNSYENPRNVGVLGAARYVIRAKIRKGKYRRGVNEVLKDFERMTADLAVLEPTPTEKAMAAALELLAQNRGVNLDVGESQLCAIAIERLIPFLVTGDKRAIIALEILHNLEPKLQRMRGKLVCLEQLVVDLLNSETKEMIREAICGEPETDKSLTICFACASSEASLENISGGLHSYIDDLRTRAINVLRE